MSGTSEIEDEVLSLEDAIARALELHRGRRYGEAVHIYRQVLGVRPDLAAVHSNLGAALQAMGELERAAASYREALRIAPDSVQLHGNLGTALHGMGRYEDAVESYRKAQALGAGDTETLCNLGATLEALDRLDEAERCLRKALARSAGHARTQNNLGTVLRKRGRLDEAVACYRRAVELMPQYGIAAENLKAAQAAQLVQQRIARVRRALRRHPRKAALHDELGSALKEAGELDEAIAAYRGALAVDPVNADALCNLGAALAERGDLEDAMESYGTALRLAPDRTEIHNNLGAALQRQERFEEAVECFRSAVTRQPDVYQYQSNLASALFAAERYDEAIDIYRSAIAVAPGVAELHRNLASVLLFRERTAEAIASYRRAIELRPRFPEALRNLGAALGKAEQRPEAVRCLREALQLDPSDAESASALAHHLQHLCAWEEWEALQPRILSDEWIASGKLSALGLISLESTPAQQLRAARASADKPEARARTVVSSWPGAVSAPLRVGYLSADFREHPVAYLTAELFELHERSRVEVYAYSLYGAGEQSAVRERIRAAAHHFVDVEALSSRAIAERIRADGIAVLIDLTGYTQHARTGVLALRPAPVQVSYLGYPGTMGAPFIDYLIGDSFVTPPRLREHYSEKLVVMPHCFQPNDRSKAIAEAVPDREGCGLPREGFVFCSFNKSYKLTPRVFDVWMRLLAAVPGSVLWLSDASASAMENLKREANERGVEARRLVFAPRVETMDGHLGRHRHADLFLDTLPYNAHTTASDALWSGLPVLTCAGETFASRVAGSLLHAVGLPELVTHTLEEYEALALGLARDPARLASLRTRLAHNRLTYPLFDSAGYTRDLERACERMWDNHARGNPPSQIEIAHGGEVAQ